MQHREVMELELELEIQRCAHSMIREIIRILVEDQTILIHDTAVTV
jgi:hypothetical protein